MTCILAVVCEAAADQRTACAIADRVLCDELDVSDSSLLDTCRVWRGFDSGTTFTSWMHLKRIAAHRGIRMPHGHFAGEPGAPDAAAARRAIWVMRSMDTMPAGLLLIRDSDGDEARRLGLCQAREAAAGAPPTVVIALAHTKRECWVLAGFDPRDESERKALDELRRELGFNPTLHSERLVARHDDDRRSAKRVVARLCGDLDREQGCLTGTSLETMRSRGTNNGLAAFMQEIRERIVPLFDATR